MMTVEQGMKEIMAILGEDYDDVKNEEVLAAGGAHVTSTISTISTISTVSTVDNKTSNALSIDIPATPPEVVYENGRAISINGVPVAKGYKKGAKRVSNAKDKLRADLMDSAMVVLNRVKAFEGKVFMSKTEGIVIKLTDADYTVKVTGHAKPEFADRDADFVPEKNYLTRGTGENHSSAIAKFLVSEIENENPILKIENQKPVTLLSAKSSTIRFEVEGAGEFSFRITRKRSRVVVG